MRPFAQILERAPLSLKFCSMVRATCYFAKSNHLRVASSFVTQFSSVFGAALFSFEIPSSHCQILCSQHSFPFERFACRAASSFFSQVLVPFGWLPFLTLSALGAPVPNNRTRGSKHREKPALAAKTRRQPQHWPSPSVKCRLSRSTRISQVNCLGLSLLC